MISKNDVIQAAQNIGFADIGFTTSETFDSHRDLLLSKKEEYGWTETAGIDLLNGTNPKNILPNAKSIIVLLEIYYRGAFPRSLEANFGRCYLDDDRITKDGLAKKIKAFRNYLRENGIDSKVPFNVPHRLAAARAGVGTFGKNCLLYSNRAARKSSWISPVAVIVDREFGPDEPTLEFGCPSWCRNACISSCPTKALKGMGTIDPRMCISYLTYYGEGLTPVELREPMGTFVYGCDRCQNVCPRNTAWSAQDLIPNPRVAAKAKDFELSVLLHMDKKFFQTRIWPHMFYMSPDEIWRWKMNAARAMGNSLDPKYIPDLIRAFTENSDVRVRCMTAWAMGRIGGSTAKNNLNEFLKNSSDIVQNEILYALDLCTGKKQPVS